jgi:hypothetical protein
MQHDELAPHSITRQQGEESTLTAAFERFDRLEIADELGFGRSLDRKGAGMGARYDFSYVRAGMPESVNATSSKAAQFDKLASI